LSNIPELEVRSNLPYPLLSRRGRSKDLKFESLAGGEKVDVK
jgi:hypothetical protein